MKKLDLLAGLLVIVGALNWGLVAVAEFDLVAWIFGGMEFGETNAPRHLWARRSGGRGLHGVVPGRTPDRAATGDSRGAVMPARRARALLLVAAFVSFSLSVSLWFSGSEEEGIFVGLWVPSILALGALVAPRAAR